MRQVAERYVAQFGEIVRLQRLVGINETEGLQGALHGSVHDAEAMLEGIVDQPKRSRAHWPRSAPRPRARWRRYNASARRSTRWTG